MQFHGLIYAPAVGEPVNDGDGWSGYKVATIRIGRQIMEQMTLIK